MNKIAFVLFSLVWILTLTAIILLRGKALVFDKERGLKIYVEEEDADER